MKKLSLLLLLIPTLGLAQSVADYYSLEVKNKLIDKNVNAVYYGCLSNFELGLIHAGKENPRTKEKLSRNPLDHLKKEVRYSAVSKEEMNKLSERVKDVVSEYYAYSLGQNPEIKKSFEEDLQKISSNPECQQTKNDCRALLIATAHYYIKPLRPSLPYCEGYDTDKLSKKELEKLKSGLASAGMNYAHRPEPVVFCELEKQMKDKPIKAYSQSHPLSRYTEEATAMANQAMSAIHEEVLYPVVGIKKKQELIDPNQVFICDPDKSMDSVVYQSPLQMVLYTEPYSKLAIRAPAAVEVKQPKECIEEKITLYSEFVPTNFDEGRSTVGKDQLDPVKEKISSFISAHPEMIVTDVSVTSSSSKTPFHITVAGKKKIDPESDKRNLALAEQRSGFASQALSEIQKSSSALTKVNFTTKAELAGPDFTPTDLNTRFMTKMTKGYKEKIQALYEENKKIYEEQALTKSAEELMDDKKFVNFYQAKYKPFQGFRIAISGYKKEQMKCSDHSGSKKAEPAKASKQ